MTKVIISNHVIEITHPDKPYFTPDLVKSDLIHYYKQIAPIMLPYVRSRPVTLQRFPDGAYGEGFFQKDIPDYFPDYVKRVTVEKQDGGSTTYVLCNNTATLVYLAQQSCVTPHIWLSKLPKLHKPDRMIFDLDPSGNDFEMVRHGAFEIKAVLEKLELNPHVMTTGSRGLHIVVPIQQKYSFEEVRALASAIAQRFVQFNPKLYTTQLRKDKRGKLLFLDTHRNSFTATGVAPYAVRAREYGPIATPLTWQECAQKDINSQSFNLNNIWRLLDKRPDPWRGLHELCSLEKALSYL